MEIEIPMMLLTESFLNRREAERTIIIENKIQANTS